MTLNESCVVFLKRTVIFCESSYAGPESTSRLLAARAAQPAHVSNCGQIISLVDSQLWDTFEVTIRPKVQET